MDNRKRTPEDDKRVELVTTASSLRFKGEIFIDDDANDEFDEPSEGDSDLLSVTYPSPRRRKSGRRISLLGGARRISMLGGHRMSLTYGKRASITGSKRLSFLGTNNAPMDPNFEYDVGDFVDVQLDENIWAEGQVVKKTIGVDGKPIYEIDCFTCEHALEMKGAEIHKHDSEQDLFGMNQLDIDRPSKSKSIFGDLLALELREAQKHATSGNFGFMLFKRRMKTHFRPIMFCIPIIIIFVIISQLEVLEYVDDGSLGTTSHRRSLAGADTTSACDHAPADPHHRRILGSSNATDPYGAGHTDPGTTSDPCEPKKTTKKLPADAYLVGCVICCAVVFLLMEYPGWIIMILSAQFLVLADIITEEDSWHAMGFPTLLACCSVTAVAKGLANTHVVKLLMEAVFDMEASGFVRLTVLFFITGAFSTIIDNFAVIGIFQYIYHVYSKKSQTDERLLLMPLSFISMIGGTCTVLASGAMLVAKSFLEQDSGLEGDQKDLGLFEMTVMAVPVLLISCPFLAWYAPLMLAPKALPEHAHEFESDSEVLEEHGHTEESGYVMKFKLREGCKASHIHSLENASFLWKEVHVKGLVGLQHVNHDSDITEGDIVYALAPGYKIHDLDLHGFQLMEINENRQNIIDTHKTVVVEGIVDPKATFVGVPYSRLSKYVRHWHILGVYTHGKTYPSASILHSKVRGGDMILMEGRRTHLHHKHTGFISIVEQDTEHTHDVYMFQLYMSAGCLLMVIICTVTGLLSLMQTVVISLLVLIQTGCLTIEEMLHKFKWRVLLLITGAYAIAHAFVVTNLAAFLSQHLLKITEDDTGILWIMYILAVLLGMAFPPKAEIGILYPVCLTLQAEVSGLTMKKLIIVVLQGTAIQLLTPNNPENSLIAEPYAFMDFFKTGLPLAVLSGVIFIPLVQALYSDIND